MFLEMWLSLKTISLSIARFLSYWTIDIHHTRFPHVHATPDNAINIQPAPQPVLENVHLQPETFIHNLTLLDLKILLRLMIIPTLKSHSQQSHLPDQQATITQPILSYNVSQSTNNKVKYHILSKAGNNWYSFIYKQYFFYRIKQVLISF